MTLCMFFPWDKKGLNQAGLIGQAFDKELVIQMKLSQNSFDEFEYYITPSDMIEFLYCRRFIYYMKCLSIPQFEENRFKVQKGREVHEKKESQNKQYLRKKLGVVDKQIDVDLYSKKFKIKGIVDEVVTLEDGSKAPLD